MPIESGNGKRKKLDISSVWNQVDLPEQDKRKKKPFSMRLAFFRLCRQLHKLKRDLQLAGLDIVWELVLLKSRKLWIYRARILLPDRYDHRLGSLVVRS
jgi:hypothetical protein